MDRSDVFAVTRFFLAREPRSEEAVKKRIENTKSVPILVQQILESAEFHAPHCTKRLSDIALTSELIEEGFRLILDRSPEDKSRRGYLSSDQNLYQFIQSLSKSKEYQNSIAKMGNIKGLTASDEFNSTPKTIYLHIPKTAGKSFESLALANYSSDCTLSTNGKAVWEEWQRSKLVGGHFQYSAYSKSTSKRLFLSVVRDPVDRAISRFNFYKNQLGGHKKRIERDFDHTDMKATIRKSPFRKEFVDNYQCCYLSSGKNFKSVQKAFKNDAFIVGHFDDIESWIKLVGERLGWPEFHLPEKNVATDRSYDLEYHQDQELVSTLRKRNKEDFKLVEFIKKNDVYESAGDSFDYTLFRLDN